MNNEEIIIKYNSKTYNDIFFKKKEKSNLLLKICKDHIKYIISPFDEILTYKINITKRLILYNKLIKKYILNKILIDNYSINEDGIINNIFSYIGHSVKNIYIDNKNILKI